MRVAIFGATGRTGRLVVDDALARGFDVTAFVRRTPDPAFDQAVRVVTGDARDPEHVRAALEGADAVVSVLAIREGTEPTTELSEATHTIIEAMRAHGPRRLVLTVNTSVFHDRPVSPPFGIVADEHRRNVALLRATSDLDWTVLAPMFLTDDPPSGRVRTEVDAKAPGKGLTRADLATAVLDAIAHEDWIGHVVGASN
ncbi:MAG: NAD(P)H-binding protein [Actinomycetota bacterium]